MAKAVKVEELKCHKYFSHFRAKTIVLAKFLKTELQLLYI